MPPEDKPGSPGARTETEDASQAGGQEPTASDLGRQFLSHLSTYITTQWDLACLSAWGLVVRLVFLISVAVLMVAASITVGILAIHYVMSGLAGGIGLLAGDRLWVGRLVTGLLVLVTLVITVATVIWRYQSISHRELRAKYEQHDPNEEQSIEE
jgi:hypothetical protein